MEYIDEDGRHVRIEFDLQFHVWLSYKELAFDAYDTLVKENGQEYADFMFDKLAEDFPDGAYVLGF